MSDKIKAAAWGGSIALVAVICIVVTWIVRGKIDNITPKDLVPDIEVPKVEEEKAFDSATIKSGLHDMGKLVTAEYRFTHVEKFESSKKIGDFDLGKLGKKQLIYSYDGNVKAGVDFAKIEVETDDEAKTIRVVIPEPEFISSEVYPDSFALYDEQESLFNQLSSVDFAASFDDIKTKEEKKAKEDGLLELAKTNADSLIGNFIANVDTGDYKVIIIDRTEEKEN